MPTTWPVNLLGLIFLIINVLCWIFLSWKYEWMSMTDVKVDLKTGAISPRAVSSTPAVA